MKRAVIFVATIVFACRGNATDELNRRNIERRDVEAATLTKAGIAVLTRGGIIAGAAEPAGAADGAIRGHGSAGKCDRSPGHVQSTPKPRGTAAAIAGRAAPIVRDCASAITALPALSDIGGQGIVAHDALPECHRPRKRTIQ